MKLLNAFFIGHILIYALLFSVFVGLKIGYFNHYEIDEYFNIIFVDNVAGLYFLLPCLISGYLILYINFRNFFRAFYALCLIVSILFWIPDNGKSLGEYLFKDGDTLYVSRKHTYILNQNAQTIKIKN
ncbi:isoleucyl-tRNA synthetase [Campylobacter majalis]|uniref:isoleucyl-tRNA synthetase n=1 Tax=Campylobacter majalis TaxID=2790656 RepID=UPI003D69DE7A